MHLHFHSYKEILSAKYYSDIRGRSLFTSRLGFTRIIKRCWCGKQRSIMKAGNFESWQPKTPHSPSQ